MTQDLPYILKWWLMIFGLGLLVWPLTKRVFSKFFDLGYAFSKILAILLLSYLVWFLGSLKILPFFQETIFLVIIALALLNLLIFKETKKEGETKDAIAYRLYPSFLKLFKRNQKKENQKNFPNGEPAGHQIGKILVFEEALFLLAFLFWAWVRAHEPSIHGLEKFMDFGFINSILNSKFFPPSDPWLAPATDPRYTGTFTINYYYFGHLAAAVLTKLSGIDSAITYNLVLATLFGLCFSGAFSIGANLLWLNTPRVPLKSARKPSKASNTRFKALRKFAIDKTLGFLSLLGKFSKSEASKDNNRQPSSGRALSLKRGMRASIAAGLLTAFLVTLAGNLHPIYLFLKDSSQYWYPDATRFIRNTIHEFPSYSWVVADLHGHVFDIPFVLLAIAMLIALLNSKLTPSVILNPAKRGEGSRKGFFATLRMTIKRRFRISDLGFRILLLGLVLAVLYMTNAWDGLIYLGLSGLVILATHLLLNNRTDQTTKEQKYNLKPRILSMFFVICSLLFTFFLFASPFIVNFTPFVKGIGVNCPPSFLPEKWGPFLFLKQNCQRSPLWKLAILWGFFYFNAVAFIIFLLKNSKLETRNSKQTLNSNVQNSKQKKFRSFGSRILDLFRISDLGFRILRKVDILILLMILLSTFLLIFPEFFYAKDIYPAHFRANTMFKLGYQAFIMMSIVSGYVIIKALNRFKQMKKQIKTDKFFVFCFLFFVFLFPQLFLVSIYPYYAINSYYGNLKTYRGLNGAQWLKQQYPDDYQAITWLKRNRRHETCYMLHATCYPPVLVEAVGESYTDYARVSAYTGYQTILGWPVHEWLWRGSYDEPGARIPEVQTIYESKDIEETKKMLEKYNVDYIFLGQLEREKYKNLNEEKFAQLGEIVFKSGETRIFKLRFSH